MAKRKRKSVRGGAPNRTGRVNRTTVAKKRKTNDSFVPANSKGSAKQNGQKGKSIEWSIKE